MVCTLGWRHADQEMDLLRDQSIVKKGFEKNHPIIYIPHFLRKSEQKLAVNVKTASPVAVRISALALVAVETF